jgi:hypothetical protein
LSFFYKIFKHYIQEISPYLALAIKNYNLPAVRFLLETVDPNKQIPKRWQEHFFYMLYPLSYTLRILQREYLKFEDLELRSAAKRQKREEETTIRLQKEKIKKVGDIIQELIKAGSNIWLEGEPLVFQPVYLALDIPLSFSHDIKELLEVLLQYNREEINRIWRDQEGQEITLRDFIDSGINNAILTTENPEEAEEMLHLHREIKTILNEFNAKKRAELTTKTPWAIWPVMSPEQLERFRKWQIESVTQ